MALYLVQHGKSLPKDQDAEQGLSAEGRADVERISLVAKGYGVRPSAIRHSGKERARESAEIIAESLLPDGPVEQISGIDPLDDVTIIAKQLKTDDNLMIVGHLPFLEKLTGLLVAGLPERLVFKFQNGGIVCLDKNPESQWWFVKWALMPKVG